MPNFITPGGLPARYVVVTHALNRGLSANRAYRLCVDHGCGMRRADFLAMYAQAKSNLTALRGQSTKDGED